MVSFPPSMLEMFSSLTQSVISNSTNPGHPTNAVKTPLITTDNQADTHSLVAFLFSFSALRDWIKLFIIGGFFEACRRLVSSGFDTLVRSFFVNASFDQGDSSYEWILFWITKQPSWSKTQDVQITTKSFGLTSPAVLLDDEDKNIDRAFGSPRKISYLPSASLTYAFWYQKRWVTITRVQQQTGLYGIKENTLHLRILTRDHNLLKNLLREARRLYTTEQVHNMCIYISNSSNQWNHVACRAKRLMGSIVLDPGVKDLLLEDARDFMRSKKWYAERGIPFRRGYLLYGSPGSGKTSMIHCMAGELGLDVYIISLSRAGLDDTSLSELVNALPDRCVALMEDIDAAFTHAITRAEGPEFNAEETAECVSMGGTRSVSTNKLSLSGLLNALDGVGAQEGRILFATTNKYSALDPALCRPGRMDLHVEFKNASKYQARELFNRFYLPTEVSPLGDSDDGNVDEFPSDGTSEKNKLYQEKLSQLPLAAFTGNPHAGKPHKLGQDDVAKLAERFADAIPEREWSMASLQGYLMAYKTRPIQAVDEVGAWMLKERAFEGKKQKKETKSVMGAVGLKLVHDIPPPRLVEPPTGCTRGAGDVAGHPTTFKPSQILEPNAV